jgi:molybdenum cofactor cytidylyltransferase
MGRPKQLLIFNGRTLLRRAAEEALASGCRPIVTVLGAFADRLSNEVADLGVQVVTHHGWRGGMGSSVRVGLNALLDGPQGSALEAVILMVCDQPFCTAPVLRRLLETHQELKSPAVASYYKGVCGVPALFSRSLFPELLDLRGPGGASSVLERHRQETLVLPFAPGAIDIDTREDYVQSQASYATLSTLGHA